MSDTNDSPLTEWLGDAFEVLAPAIKRKSGLTPEEAHDHLQAAGFTKEDAKYAIKRLHKRGYLYEVDGQLFVTEPQG